MKLKGLFSTIVAIATGMIVLIGTFLPVEPLATLRVLFLQWGSALAGIAILVGVGNLFSVHIEKVRERTKQSIYSIALLSFLMLTWLLVVLPIRMPIESILLNGIMVPIEISLLAILSVSLIYASVRLLRYRADLKSIIFIVTALIVLGDAAIQQFVGPLPIISDWVHPFVSQILAAGGARGILIGVALGSLMTGLRVLFGADRPYGGK